MVRGTGRAALRGPTGEAARRIFRWQFMMETWAELKKVTWPTREEALRLTMLVFALSVTIGIMLGLIDFIFNQVVNRLFIR